MQQQIPCSVIVALATIILVGCIAIPIPLPPKGDIYTTKQDIEDLVDNSESKTEVIEQLGNPLKYRITSMSYKACRAPAGVGLILVALGGLGGDYQELRGETECFELQLNFDQNNHLTGYQEIPWLNGINSEKEDMILMALADQGDAVAQRLWQQSGTYLSSEEYEIELAQRIEQGDNRPVVFWKLYLLRGCKPEDIQLLCKGADGGIITAQALLGWSYRIGNGVPRDLQRSYMWYKLASSQSRNGNEYYDKSTQQNASNQLAHLKKTMTEREIAEAEQQFSEWKPGQCDQELTPGNADD